MSARLQPYRSDFFDESAGVPKRLPLPAVLVARACAADPRLTDQARLDAVVPMRPAVAAVFAGAVVTPEGVDSAPAAAACDAGCAVAGLELA